MRRCWLGGSADAMRGCEQRALTGRGRMSIYPHPAPSGLLAFGDGIERIDDIERGPGRAAPPPAAARVAARHARDRPDHGPLCRRLCRHAHGRRACRVRTPARRTRPGPARLGDRRIRDAARIRHAVLPPPARLSLGRGAAPMKADVKSPAELLRPGRPLTLAQVADGAEGLVLADLARAIAARRDAPAISLAVICRDGPRMAQLARALSFFGPDIVTLEFPAWDCLPYDRVSPNAGAVAQRMTALSRLARVKGRDKPSVLLTTVNAASQRVPPRDFVATHALSVAPGHVMGMAGIVEWLELNGFTRASTVREPGEYAVRGGILDLFPPGMDMPVRLDFFGDAIETIRSFDAQTQRSEGDLRGLDLVPVAEFQLVTETIRRFRTGYVAQFGATTPDDLLYEAVSEGRRYPGIEHWLPLFHDKLETIFDYLPDTPLALEHLAEDAAHERFTQITDYYDARRDALKQGATPPYKPLPPERLYLGEAEWKKRLDTSALARMTPFAVPETDVLDVGARSGRNFAAERAEPGANVFEALGAHVLALQAAGTRVAIAL